MSKKWVFTERYVKQKLDEYQHNCKLQTFKGALLYIGLFGEDLNKIRVDAENGNRAAIHIWKMLETYKFALEVKMEEWLLYQGNHPDLQNLQHYNYKHLEFLLKCSNRTYYDNGMLDASKVLPRARKVEVEEENVLPANTTDLKLWNK